MISAPYRFVLPVLSFALWILGCQSYEHRLSGDVQDQRQAERVAVLGFRPAPLFLEEESAVQSPLTGSVFIRGAVPGGVPEEMTARLYDDLSKQMNVQLISPDMTAQALLAIVDRSYGADEKELLQQLGEALSVDAVLAGHIFRWKERIGTDFAVSRPASVAFELALVTAADGTVIWKGKFDKTQASLMENLMDLSTFLRGKGRWMVVEELAAIGLSDLLKELPLRSKD